LALAALVDRNPIHPTVYKVATVVLIIPLLSVVVMVKALVLVQLQQAELAVRVVAQVLTEQIPR
jgi:hypothetical protein